eukprot:CAMPEP_0114240112 /NCGR_PEP_ID=MMETSP0058-20121206/8859_1 /TAXON_ID=36894 /ORGANISM="Pyramimonas parkeae, CCMP726" /LENGTH=108 /DNA_ID=CAMNT_0001352417 /DNA_START=538 /DNA_END=864 /DNA_ORIENTATION=-
MAWSVKVANRSAPSSQQTRNNPMLVDQVMECTMVMAEVSTLAMGSKGLLQSHRWMQRPSNAHVPRVSASLPSSFSGAQATNTGKLELKVSRVARNNTSGWRALVDAPL